MPTWPPAGKGWSILDITTPPRPVVDQVYNAGGCINDLNDVKLGITNASEFAYLADGCNGMRGGAVDLAGDARFDRVQPAARAPADRHLPHVQGRPRLAISKGVDRDRAVDESGNQLAVFGRVGARPLNLEEQQRMYLHDGRLWRVSDDPFDSEIYRPMVGPRPASPMPRLQMPPSGAGEAIPPPPPGPVR